MSCVFDASTTLEECLRELSEVLSGLLNSVGRLSLFELGATFLTL